MVVGAILLASLSFWVVSTLRQGLEVPEITLPHTAWLGSSAGFTPHTSLPPARQEEIRKLHEEAIQIATLYATRNRTATQWSQYMDWIAFGLSSFIMLLAGYFGRLPESGADATAAAHSLQSGEGSKKKGKQRRGARVVSSRSGFAALVGIIAALATTATGASNRLQASAAQNLDNAKAISEAIVKTSKIAIAPTSEADLEEALQALRQTLVLLAP
jgi:hypothetical protein